MALLRLVAAIFTVLLFAASASATEKMTYLFPAPSTLPAFAPFQIAKAKGYYQAEGLDVIFAVGKGGADVATQVAVGNADLGGGIGDTSIIVRPNGLPVKAVALLGGRSLHQIVARKDAKVASLADLKGKKIGVVAFQDTSYYNLLAVLASQGISKSDVTIQAVGVAGVVQLMIAGDIQVICGAPEWALNIERAGVPVDVLPIDGAFPAMAQAIMASDKIIKERPGVVRGFVRATLKAVREISQDPAAAAKAFIAAVPQQRENEAGIAEMMRRYARTVYPVGEGKTLGEFDLQRVAAVQKFYVENKIIGKATPVSELFTNEFVKQ